LRVIVLSGYGIEIRLSEYVGQVGRLYQSSQSENDKHHFERRFCGKFFQQCKPQEVKPVATALPYLVRIVMGPLRRNGGVRMAAC
jgi:hypothetical protein